MPPIRNVNIQIASPKDGDDVPYRAIVNGSVRPPGTPVQVFVEAGTETDKWWYPQGNRASIPSTGAAQSPAGVVAEAIRNLERTRWANPCIFGNPESSLIWYRIIAIAGVSEIKERRVKELPASAARSNIVWVRRK